MTRYGEVLRRYGLRRVSWNQIIDLHLYGILSPSSAGRNIVEMELDHLYGDQFPPFLPVGENLASDPEFRAIQQELNRGIDYERQRKGVPLSDRLLSVLATLIILFLNYNLRDR